MLSLRKYFLTGLVMAALSWGGLVLLWHYTLPTLGPRWLFFYLFVLALCSTALPVVAFINIRFPSEPPATVGVIIRQSVWVGIYGGLLAWLQLGRVLNSTRALFIAAALVLIEYLLRLWDHARFKPKPAQNE